MLIVEHDPDIVNIADHVVDMGPGAGKDGGNIVYTGALSGLKDADTLTGRFWRYEKELESTSTTNQDFFNGIRNARLHNLNNVTVKIPQRVITAVTGMAGSGKSSLINQELPCQHPHVKLIDQGLLRGSRRSHLASYTGIFDVVPASIRKNKPYECFDFQRKFQRRLYSMPGLGIISA